MMQTEEYERRENNIRDALRIVVDPELGINLVDLGMIYLIVAHSNGDVSVKMTTTTPGCPAAGFLTMAVKSCVENVTGVKQADVELTYEPVWRGRNKSSYKSYAKLERMKNVLECAIRCHTHGR